MSGPGARSGQDVHRQPGAVAVLTVPDFDGSEDTCTAALAYAAAGIYGGPLRFDTDEGKHPGSILGTGWPAKTTCDPQVIVAMLAGTSGVGWFLHMGRSGLVGFDIDTPANVPSVLADAIRRHRAPIQATRADGSRFHAVFAQPPGRSFGNGTGTLGKGWGEVRGRNGILVAYPAGERHWLQTGPIPPLPEAVARLLTDTTDADAAATDAEVAAFLDAHTEAAKPNLFAPVLNDFAARLAKGESRHEAAVVAACWAMRETAAGCFPARDADRQLRAAYVEARAVDRDGGRPGCSKDQAHAEFAGILAWAIGQARAVDPDATRAKVNDRTDSLGINPLRIADNGQHDVRADDMASGVPTSSWLPEDLSVDEPPPRPPRWLTRAAHPSHPAVSLIYPGRVHWLSGEPESGKSWLALVGVKDALEQGDRVAYVDCEDSRATFTERLTALRVDVVAHHRAGRIRYVRPRDPLTNSPPNAAALAQLVAWRPALVVVDGVTEAMTLEGRDPSDNADVARWLAQLPLVLADAGAAVLCIDHVTKAREGRGRWAIGGQHKLAAVDGASYTVEMTKRWGRAVVNDEVTGTLLVRLAKDRAGWLQTRVNADQVIADVTVTVYRSGDVTFDLRPPGVTARDDLARRIAEHLAIYPGTSKRELRELGGATTVDETLKRLVLDGHVTVERHGQAHRHHLTDAGRDRWVPA